jgi:hypothetical protein
MKPTARARLTVALRDQVATIAASGCVRPWRSCSATDVEMVVLHGFHH